MQNHSEDTGLSQADKLRPQAKTSSQCFKFCFILSGDFKAESKIEPHEVETSATNTIQLGKFYSSTLISVPGLPSFHEHHPQRPQLSQLPGETGTWPPTTFSCQNKRRPSVVLFTGQHGGRGRLWALPAHRGGQG